MRSTACRSWDARATSASPDVRRGWDESARIPDPCTTPACTGAIVGVQFFAVPATATMLSPMVRIFGAH